MTQSTTDYNGTKARGLDQHHQYLPYCIDASVMWYGIEQPSPMWSSTIAIVVITTTGPSFLPHLLHRCIWHKRYSLHCAAVVGNTVIVLATAAHSCHC